MNTRNNLKQKALLLLLLMAVGAVKAQSHEFAPVGAEWYYTRFYRIGQAPHGIANDRFQSLRTVEINGWECKEIELYQHLDCHGVVNPYTEIRYITQEDDQVYEVENGQRYLLYDFSKEVGESWYAPKYDDTITVLNVSYITLNDGTVRKVLETQPSNFDWYFYNIIEGVGMEYSLFPFDHTMVGTPCVEGPLRCYSEAGVPLISWSETECDYEVVAIDEYGEEAFVNMNTLIDNMLQIEFSENFHGLKLVIIVDVMGKIVSTHKTIENTLDISFADNPNGLYLVQVTMNSQLINRKIVKK